MHQQYGYRHTRYELSIALFTTAGDSINSTLLDDIPELFSMTFFVLTCSACIMNIVMTTSFALEELSAGSNFISIYGFLMD